jgi:hypothetical protein
MELVEIRKGPKGKAAIKLRIADTLKEYEFSYFDREIFAVDFPEELRMVLRVLPPKVTQGLVRKIKSFTTADPGSLPHELELERRALQLV